MVDFKFCDYIQKIAQIAINKEQFCDTNKKKYVWDEIIQAIQ